VLVPELKPCDSEWLRLCKELNVRLAFPPDFDALTDETTFPTAPLNTGSLSWRDWGEVEVGEDRMVAVSVDETPPGGPLPWMLDLSYPR